MSATRRSPKDRQKPHASMYLGAKVVSALQKNDLNSKKGPVFQTAIIAGIQGVKKTSDLIPMCHPLPLNGISIDIDFIDDESILIRCRVNMEGKTGVEMEALTGASTAALTIYDMCKSLSQEMRIEQVRLVEKKGGKSDIDLRNSSNI